MKYFIANIKKYKISLIKLEILLAFPDSRMETETQWKKIIHALAIFSRSLYYFALFGLVVAD